MVYDNLISLWVVTCPAKESKVNSDDDSPSEVRVKTSPANNDDGNSSDEQSSPTAAAPRTTTSESKNAESKTEETTVCNCALALASAVVVKVCSLCFDLHRLHLHTGKSRPQRPRRNLIHLGVGNACVFDQRNGNSEDWFTLQMVVR